MDGSTARESRWGDEAGTRARDRSRLLRRLAASAGEDDAPPPGPGERTEGASEAPRPGPARELGPSGADAGPGQDHGPSTGDPEPGQERGRSWDEVASTPMSAPGGDRGPSASEATTGPGHEPGRAWAATAGLRHTRVTREPEPRRGGDDVPGASAARLEAGDPSGPAGHDRDDAPEPEAAVQPQPNQPEPEGRPWVATAGLPPVRRRR